MQQNMKFNGATRTTAGYTTKNVTFNSIGNCYIGKVADPHFPEREWTTASWDKRGRCRNQTRSDCNLIKPE